VSKKIKRIENKIYKIKREQSYQNSINQLKQKHEYLLKNKIYFGDSRYYGLEHATNAYDIASHHYPLVLNNLDLPKSITSEYMYTLNDNSLSIVGVQMPSNEIQEYLYPHVVDYLKNDLPIQLIKKNNDGSRNYDDYGVYLVPNTNKSVRFNMFTSTAYVPLEYLKIN